jgi:prepilin-type N-terminal cleavage/methylation domain-containing protein
MKSKTSGFTLVEMVTVMMIIGSLVMMALPKYTLIVEKGRAAEGVQYLFSLLSAQKRYSIDHDNGDSTPDYADTVSALDVGMNPPRNFNTPTDADINTTNPIARITRNDSSYTLFIADTGVITCTGAGSVCQSLGY